MISLAHELFMSEHYPVTLKEIYQIPVVFISLLHEFCGLELSTSVILAFTFF